LLNISYFFLCDAGEEVCPSMNPDTTVLSEVLITKQSGQASD
jgi:hypothetical protein